MIDLFGDNNFIDFSSDFYTKHLITYIGNKRALLPFINSGIETVKKSLGIDKLFCLDGFAGSGVVSRLLKHHSRILHSNDIENYSYIINQCYLSNKSDIDEKYIKNILDILNNIPEKDLYEGFITKNYSPKNDDDIKEGERVFYTHKNALIIDTIKKMIFETIPKDKQKFFLSPLLINASVHTNTSGVFKGFHKKNGIGHFGGAGENALTRIKGKIFLENPVFSEEECEVRVFNQDINELIKKTENQNYDLVYYDPPYNQHPYGSNYFMLNIIANPSEEIEIQTGVSGIAKDWYKSAYNKKDAAIVALEDLIKNTKSKYILISYNNEVIIPFDTFKDILNRYGKVSVLEKDYNTYRGCRNLNNRDIKVKELLWILEKR